MSLYSEISSFTPRHYWRLNETSGTTASDGGTATDNGTYVTGCTINQTGLPLSGDPAVALASSGYVQTASSVATNGVPSAILLFFKTTSSGGLIAHTTANTNTGTTLMGLYVGSDGLLHGGFYTGSAYVTLSGSTTVTDGNWHMAALSWASNGNMSLIQDGAVVATNTNTTAIPSTTGYWLLGLTPGISSWPNGGNAFLTGTISQGVYFLTASGGTIPGTSDWTTIWNDAVPTYGTGAGSFAFTGAAAGTPQITGTGAGSFSFAGSGTGSAAGTLTGTGTGTFSFTGTATGSVPTPPPLPPATSYPAGSGLKPFTYCCYDLLSGQFLGTLPLSQVTFGSQLLQPGTFSGTIDVASAAVQNLGVFDLIQPGRTALLIDYLGSFIWGGIIWTAPYDQDDTKREVQIGATEIWSYLQNQRVQATDYSAPPFSGITGNSTPMPIWDATGTSVEEGGPGTYDPVLIAWQMLYDAIYVVPNGNLFGGTGIAANGYTDASDYLASGTNTPEADYLGGESYPYSSMQQLGSALNQLATLGLGVGFDYAVDVSGTATGPVTCTVNLSYPRRGRAFAQNNLVLDCQRALKFSFPPDATQTANTVYEQGANGALSVSQNAQPLDGGFPILERIMPRSNMQSANVMGVLQQCGAADLAIYSYPVYTPVVTTDLFTGPLQLGQFMVGDDVWLRIPATDGVGNVFCPRFPTGLDVEARVISYQATVADAGTSTLDITLSEPPSYTVTGPWLP